MRFSRAGVVTAAALAALGGPAPERVAAEAVTFQADAQHSGFVERGGPAPPLRRRWVARLDDAVSYPVAGDGRVFVVTHGRWIGRPRVVALSARDGRILWQRPTVTSATLAYDAGRLFVLRANAYTELTSLLALSPDDGRVLWESGPSLSGGAIPVAEGGAVYLGHGYSPGGVSAWSQDDGRLLWRVDATQVPASEIVSLWQDTVLLGTDCPPYLLRIRRTDGHVLTPGADDCDDGIRASPLVVAGRAYVFRTTEGDGVYDLAGGARLRDFKSHRAPAVSPEVELMVDVNRPGEPQFLDFGHRILARRAADGAVAWRFRGAGDLDSSPLIVGRTVYVGAGSGRVYGLDVRTGRARWRGDAGAPVPAYNRGFAEPGLAAAEGLLLVPALGRLVAFGR